MSEQKVVALHGRAANEYDDAFLAGVLRRLQSIQPQLPPAKKRARALLDRFAKQLIPMKSGGFSYADMSAFFEDSGIDLSVVAIQEYFENVVLGQVATLQDGSRERHSSQSSSGISRTEARLRQAIRSGNGLHVLYQPQIDVLTGRVVGAEALVRLTHDGNVIMPGEFIPVAEATGLIVEVGEWVLRAACKEASRWQDLPGWPSSTIKLGVNLSVKQFSLDLPSMVLRALADSGLHPKALGLEITESCLAGPESKRILDVLRSHGIHLSVDDFGTGYSCLAQLKDLPLDVIKIDRAFVTDLETTETSAAVVETIIGLANRLGMQTIAEGVETSDQAELLLAMGCGTCQGFLYSKPLSGDEFVKFVVDAEGGRVGGTD